MIRRQFYPYERAVCLLCSSLHLKLCRELDDRVYWECQWCGEEFVSYANDVNSVTVEQLP